jgi:hypothetical protein
MEHFYLILSSCLVSFYLICLYHLTVLCPVKLHFSILKYCILLLEHTDNLSLIYLTSLFYLFSLQIDITNL